MYATLVFSFMISTFPLHVDTSLTLNNLKTGLQGVKDWNTLGFHLDVPKSKLDAIRAECSDDPDKCLEALLDHWVKTYPALSWRRVTEALYDSEEFTVLRTIQSKYDKGYVTGNWCTLYTVICTTKTCITHCVLCNDIMLGLGV